MVWWRMVLPRQEYPLATSGRAPSHPTVEWFAAFLRLSEAFVLGLQVCSASPVEREYRSLGKETRTASFRRALLLLAILSSWCFNRTKNKYPELRFRVLLTEDGTRQMELVRAWGKASCQRLTEEQLARNEQVSGSSPLVGSLYSA